MAQILILAEDRVDDPKQAQKFDVVDTLDDGVHVGRQVLLPMFYVFRVPDRTGAELKYLARPWQSTILDANGHYVMYAKRKFFFNYESVFSPAQLQEILDYEDGYLIKDISLSDITEKV